MRLTAIRQLRKLGLMPIDYQKFDFAIFRIDSTELGQIARGDLAILTVGHEMRRCPARSRHRFLSPTT